MIQMFGWILDAERNWVGVVERVPHHVEPIAVAKLDGAIPFVDREPDRFALAPTFDFDPADAFDRIAVTSLRVGGAMAANIKTDLQMSDALTLPAISLRS